MYVLAVAQMDRIISEINASESLESLLFFHRQFSLLTRSRLVDEWICLAAAENIGAIPPALPAQLGLKLQQSQGRDSLDEFHQIASVASRCVPGNAHGSVAPVVMRVVLTTEDPDPGVIDEMIQNHASGGYDYSHSGMQDDGYSTFIEIMNFSALDEAWRKALLPDDRQQITPYIYRQRERLNIGVYSPARADVHLGQNLCA